jgi:2-keto-4-pentenoate hydratase/2-oxohepta-3-ene-1,7-dioic acid hydratase in catechol pathway
LKLIRFGDKGNERPGILDSDGCRRDCSAYFADWNTAFFQADGLNKLAEFMNSDHEALPVISEQVRLGSCIARPGKIVCIGLNYRDHAAESKMVVPEEPLVFLKAPNTIVGPYDDLLLPRLSSKVDWEIELGVVMARDTRYLASEEEAQEHIAGYCISHDVSERGFQLDRGGQWTKGKSCDTFNPVGPWLVTPDEIADVSSLQMELSVNKISKQKDLTRSMIFSPTYIVHYLSQFMTLEAGDLISTGTPPGVGFARKPPEYLRDGDVVSLKIECLGLQQQVCRPA